MVATSAMDVAPVMPAPLTVAVLLTKVPDVRAGVTVTTIAEKLLPDATAAVLVHYLARHRHLRVHLAAGRLRVQRSQMSDGQLGRTVRGIHAPQPRTKLRRSRPRRLEKIQKPKHKAPLSEAPTNPAL